MNATTHRTMPEVNAAEVESTLYSKGVEGVLAALIERLHHIVTWSTYAQNYMFSLDDLNLSELRHSVTH